MLALRPKETALSHEHKSKVSPPVIQHKPQLPHVGLFTCPLASFAQGMWLVQGSAGPRRHGSGWAPAAGKEKAQQESIALMLPTPAGWGGLLDSSTAIVSRDFGLSLALALAQFSISMAHPLFPGHDAGIQARSLSAITARDFLVG